MRFRSEKKILTSIVDKCALAAGKKGATQVLQCLLIEAKDGRLRVVGNNLHTSIDGSIDVDVTDSGAVAVDAKKFSERIKAMPDGEVEVSTDAGDTTVTVSSVGAPRWFRFQCLPGGEFPSTPIPSSDTVDVELVARDVDRAMSYVMPSMSDDEGRPHVNSALVEWHNEKIRMVSTDGHRLARIDVRTDALKGVKHLPPNTLIPKASFDVLRRLVAIEATRADGRVKVSIPRTWPDIFIGVAEMRVSVKLGTAEFPPYTLVIPKEETFKVVAVVPRERLVNVIQAVRVAADDRSSGLVLSIAKGKLAVSARHVDTGSADDEIDVEMRLGNKIKLGASAPYLLETISAMDAEEVRLCMGDELGPMVVTPEKDQTMLGIVMPMRI